MDTSTAPDRGQVDARAAEVYEAFFVPALFGQWAPIVLDAAAVASGDRVLDVGCGTGVAARAAVPRVGEAGRVVGVDPNPGMLAVARRSGVPVEWQEGTAERLPFPDEAFDAVVCQFVLMFAVDPERAVAEMWRVLRPGGRLVVATWASIDESPGYAALVALLRRVVGEQAADALAAPFRLGTIEAVADLVGSVGVEVAVWRRDGEARFASLEEWLRTDVRGWTLSGMIDDERFAELRRAADQALAAHVRADGTVRFAAPAVIATAARG